jgi:hypothetical protein
MLRVLLAFVFLTYTTNVFAFDEEEVDEDNPVTNVRIERQGKLNIFIEYDLVGEPTDVYTVTLRVKLKSDSAFAYTPLNVIGDIGANIHPGKNKRISWRVADEYQPALDKVDVQFVVTAIAPEASGGASTELYIVGGAAVVGLAVAIAILSSGKTEDGTQQSVFPLPPGRPR